MQIIDSLEKLNIDSETVITLGKFDGMHKGHRKLVNKVRALCAASGRKSLLFTFDVSPQAALGHRKNEMLLTRAERSAIVEKCGIDIMVECPFTEEFRKMEAEDFIRSIIRDKLHAAAVVIGTDYRFGKDRLGTPQMLAQAGEKEGFSVCIEDLEKEDGVLISSTQIRERLKNGSPQGAAAMLGYDYFLTGIVEPGKRIGHALGFPTINITPETEKILPPNGVYATWTKIGGKKYESLTNIGRNPTVNGQQLRVETHLLDFTEETYGQKAVIGFLQLLRKEEKFDSLQELSEQLARDVQKRKEIGSGRG